MDEVWLSPLRRCCSQPPMCCSCFCFGCTSGIRRLPLRSVPSASTPSQPGHSPGSFYLLLNTAAHVRASLVHSLDGLGSPNPRGRFFLYSLIMTRRFSPPWTVEQIPGGYKVKDANGQSLAYVYGRETLFAPVMQGWLATARPGLARFTSQVAQTFAGWGTRTLVPSCGR